MRVAPNILRVLLALGWALLFYVSVRAVRQMGFGAAGDVFFGDLAHPWRAQFNTVFGLHLLLVAAWTVYPRGSRSIIPIHRFTSRAYCLVLM